MGCGVRKGQEGGGRGGKEVEDGKGSSSSSSSSSSYLLLLLPLPLFLFVNPFPPRKNDLKYRPGRVFFFA